MTPREIELLTIAKLEHEVHQLTQADQREIHRSIQSRRTALNTAA
ncbi:Uncharacterised protein [Yersinia frederiksenii]|nr:Uncharacterised protein [Yersinia enterocolitica]CNK74170.1 Uncharacterised protein [Yersinia frederiksenii]